MDLTCDERPSDSPFVETIWHSRSEQAGFFISMAEAQCGLVVTNSRGQTAITVRGPATGAMPAYRPGEAEFFGIQFKAGVFMADFPPSVVMDRHDLDLPEAGSQSFWLNDSTWQFPNYENADTFVDRLVHDGLLVYEPVVAEVLKGDAVDMSVRTVQRRFRQATGVTQNTLYQIQRARYAVTLLKQGLSILDTVYQAGYFDQPHMTRSFRHFIGLTPAQVSAENRPERLSFLYKTASFDPVTMPQSKEKYEEDNRIRVPDTGWRDGGTRRVVLPVPE